MCLKKTLLILLIMVSGICVYPQLSLEDGYIDSICIAESKRKHNVLKGYIFRIMERITENAPPKKKLKKKLIQKPYSAFEGKTIRGITIETLDPFRTTIADTIESKLNYYSKVGNKLHLKTREQTIQNLLLIKPNQLFDSLLVNESERLIRSKDFVRDVSFFVVANSDSVDIYIRVLDIWSISADLQITPLHLFFKLVDKNFLGYCHEFQNNYIRFYTDSSNAFSTKYFVPNIGNTHINSTLHYGTNIYGVSDKSIAFERPFFSPFTRWAAGVRYSQQFRKDSIPLSDSSYDLQRVKWNTSDYWAGNAIPIFKGNSENNRQTNLVYAARFQRVNYLEIPSGVVDTPYQFADEKFLLASLGISTRKYVQDKFVFDFGLIEDVPVGKVFKITGGYQKRNNSMRIYLGGRVSVGKYYPWGYLSSNFEYGTFFYATNIEQSVVTMGVNYFSDLFEIGKWKFRQFVKPQLIVGFNRFAYENLSLNDGYGLDGFNSRGLTGTNRLLLTLQTQSYAPWNIIGYRFGPYITCSMGMLGNAETAYNNSKMYWQLGVGVLIKNEYLIINTFQFSISFYPLIPGAGQNVFKMNAIKTDDFGFRNFEIGKPAIVEFQ